MHPLLAILEFEDSLGGIDSWRRAVLVRDNHTCTLCGTYQDVEAHHIIPKYLRPDFALSLSNGMSLCLEHHNGFHAKHFAKSSQTQRTLKQNKKAYARTPLGYTREGADLVEDSDEMGTVRRIDTLLDEGISYNGIAATFNAENVPTKRGGKWFASTVRSIALNMLYEF